MPIITFLSRNEINVYQAVSDPEITNLLKEVNSKIIHQYLLRERVITPKREPLSFKKPKSFYIYEVYVRLFPNYGDAEEVQVVTFCQDNEYSINTSVTKSYIITYLFGVLNGCDFKTANK